MSTDTTPKGHIGACDDPFCPQCGPHISQNNHSTTNKPNTMKHKNIDQEAMAALLADIKEPKFRKAAEKLIHAVNEALTEYGTDTNGKPLDIIISIAGKDAKLAISHCTQVTLGGLVIELLVKNFPDKEQRTNMVAAICGYMMEEGLIDEPETPRVSIFGTSDGIVN